MTLSLTRRPLTLASLLLAAVIAAGGALALAHPGPAHAAAEAGDAPETVTVFVDAHFGMRKDHLANQLSRSHAEYAAKGYHYVDMAPYNENGDLVGVFVTYTRR